MSEPDLVTERRGNVLVLRLNRPEARNAFNPALMGATGRGLQAAIDDPEIRCVVLTGTGDKSFCAGMDLRSFADGTAPDEEDKAGMKVVTDFFNGHLPVIVVGAANASAFAGGFELLLGCDLVVAAENARFGLPEVKRGLFAAGGGVTISQRIPLAVALELTLTGDSIDADRAHELGLVNMVVPAAEVGEAAIEIAGRIAANGPLAVAATRRLVRLAVTDASGARSLQRELQPQVFGSKDAKEGARAFVEKRDPVWTGT